MTRNVSLTLLMYAAHRDGHPQAPGSYTLVAEFTPRTDDDHAAAVRYLYRLAEGRFDCQPDDVEPAWVETPGDGIHRVTWGLENYGGVLVLASVPTLIF